MGIALSSVVSPMSGGLLVVIKAMCEHLYKNCVRFVNLAVQQEVFAFEVLHSKDMANEGTSRRVKEVVK